MSYVIVGILCILCLSAILVQQALQPKQIFGNRNVKLLQNLHKIQNKHVNSFTYQKT